MHFDDRLATVLRQRVGGETIARIQYRQILDLLGAAPAGSDGPGIAAAYDRLAELSTIIPARDRARILSEPGLRLRNPHLVALLSGAEPEVATAAIRGASLDDEQWLDLTPALALHARGVLRDRHGFGPDMSAMMDRLGIHARSLPAGKVSPGQADGTARAPGTGEPLAGIGDLVRRIEAFREARRLTGGGHNGPIGDSPRLPLGDMAGDAHAGANAFDFVAGGDGRISWAGGDLSVMAIGLCLGRSDEDAAVRMTKEAARDYHRRLQLHDVQVIVDGAPAIAGPWQLYAYPRFDPVGGRYLGHAGRMLRPASPAAGTASAPAGTSASEGDRIRQLLHELRTPVNAIQGFAEVIQQQLFGPTPHEYRAHAAIIAADAARILGGFDELERLARLDTGVLSIEPGECDLAALIEAISERLAAFTGPRKGGIDFNPAGCPLPIAMGWPDAERLFWRLLATMVAACAPGERLAVSGDQGRDRVAISVILPASLASVGDEDLFSALAGQAQPAFGSGMFGTGFALRLCRAEVRAANGEMQRQDDRLDIFLPGLTERLDPHSHAGTRDGS